jgi:hypothetical protein
MFTWTRSCADHIERPLDTIRADLLACAKNIWPTRHPGRHWTRIEILGHINDATAINIQRVVRAKTDSAGALGYTQPVWTEVQVYRDYDPADLIDLWYANNRHLLWIGQHADKAFLALPAGTRYPYPGVPDVVTLSWQLGHHFLRHTLYHLMQIMGLRYRPVIEFPQIPVPDEVVAHDS